MAIFSGGSKGIGETISRSFMDNGYSVIIGSLTKPKFEITYTSLSVEIDATAQSRHKKLISVALTLKSLIAAYIYNVGYSK